MFMKIFVWTEMITLSFQPEYSIIHLILAELLKGRLQVVNDDARNNNCS